MKASTLFLGFTLVVLAAALAGLWQAFGPRPAPHAKTVSVSTPATEASIRRQPPSPPVTQPEPPDDGVRSVYPGGRPSAARPPQPETSPPALITPPAPEPMPAAIPVPAPLPAPERSAALTPPGVPRPAAPVASDATAVGEGVDLNTASVEALNTLGIGKIAKTIIGSRPYTAPDDLITRRILKRKDYDAIKPHIVVR